METCGHSSPSKLQVFHNKFVLTQAAFRGENGPISVGDKLDIAVQVSALNNLLYYCMIYRLLVEWSTSLQDSSSTEI